MNKDSQIEGRTREEIITILTTLVADEQDNVKNWFKKAVDELSTLLNTEIEKEREKVKEQILQVGYMLENANTYIEEGDKHSALDQTALLWFHLLKILSLEKSKRVDLTVLNGKIMCQLCFDYFPPNATHLSKNDKGQLTDVCIKCSEDEEKYKPLPKSEKDSK